MKSSLFQKPLTAAIALATVSASGLSTHVNAQSDSLGTIEEVVVTAQFREQSLQDTPLAITAMSADMMEARNQVSIEDVAAQAPNVSLKTMGGAFGPSIGSYIRGVGQYDFNPAYEPGVGMYVDDVYYPTLTGANFDLLDLERVEILRGPQGTLTGRNSIGGAIKLVTRKPTGEETGFVEATYGSRNRMDIRAGADFQIAENLFGRVSGVSKTQDGFVKRKDYGCVNPDNDEGILARRGGSGCTIDKMGEEGYSGARAALRWAPSDQLDVTLAADFTQIDRSNTADVLTRSDLTEDYICGDRCNYVDYQTYADGDNPANLTATNTEFEGKGVSLNVDWGLSENLQLVSISAYRTYNTQWGTDDDFTPDPSVSAIGYNDMDHEFYSQEFRLNGSVTENMDFTVGAYYSEQETVYYTVQDIRYISPGSALAFVGDDPVDADTQAVFGTLIYNVSDEFTVTAGLRYTEESKDYQFVRKNMDGTPSTSLGALDGLVASYDGDQTDYRLALDYQISDSIMVYGSVSTGFKGGGVSARPFTAEQALNGAFEPETITAYELGFKTSPFANSTLNISLFQNEYEDIQLPLADCSDFGGGPCGVRQNGGDGTFTGVEAEFSVVYGQLTLDASASYIDSEWDRVDPVVGTNVNLNDPVAFMTPEEKYSIGGQYEFLLGDSGSLYTRVDVNYQGEIFVGGRSLFGEAQYYDAETVVNARIAWRNADENLDIAFGVTNLTDEDIYMTQFNSVYSFTGTAYDTLGDPREWSLSVKRKF